jgi:hypothetical protein
MEDSQKLDDPVTMRFSLSAVRVDRLQVLSVQLGPSARSLSDRSNTASAGDVHAKINVGRPSDGGCALPSILPSCGPILIHVSIGAVC